MQLFCEGCALYVECIIKQAALEVLEFATLPTVVLFRRHEIYMWDYWFVYISMVLSESDLSARESH